MPDAAALSEIARSAILEAEAHYMARVIVDGDALAVDVCRIWQQELSVAFATYSSTVRGAAESAPISIGELIRRLEEVHPDLALAKRINEIVALERMGETS